MKPETFFDNFDVLAEAPNGVQKLRELILQLAVRGKLVAQDEKDKSTGVLIGKIKDERERLIKENKIKKGIVLPPINLNEIPFLIPKSWVFVRLNDIGDWGSGSTPDRKNNDFYGGKILWFKSGELNDGYIKESEEKITELALEKCSLRKNKPGDVLFAMYGATVGKLAILEVDATTNQAVCACTCHTGFYNRYLFYLLMAYKNRFINESSGAAQPNFSKDKIIQTIVPLPPLAEQHRIVAKVNQLMSLCDELEACQQKKRESRAHLNSAALDRLLAARAPGEFAEGWRRIYDNFDLLYDASENVGALRQAILQLAVMGKLVEQDERDEPAGVLVERLNKERNIKKTNDLIPIHENEIPYEIPKGWKWVRLGNIFSLKTGATPSTKNPNYWGGNISWLKSGDVNQGEIFDCEGRITEKGLENSNCKILPIDSVLIALNGQGKTRGTVAMLKIEAACNQSLVAMISENKNDFIPEYLFFYLKANYMNMRNITGHKQRRGLNMKIVGNLLVALPPSEEQRRIVARVDQLMSLCDKLEAGLLRSQADSERLMEAVVGRMLAG